MNEIIERLRRLSKSLKEMKCIDHIEQLDKDIDEIEKSSRDLVEVKDMKRNKYQKALKRIRNDYLNNHNPDCDIIEELVDKAIPKKVIKLPEIEYGYTHECSVCHQYVGTICESEEGIYVEENEYCCECGQKLDWSGKV